jgi:tRNA(fMet)-specific endonuclease VapC
MLILDTDHFSELMRGSMPGEHLAQLLTGREIATTIITLDEQARGWLGRIRQAKSIAETVFGYSKLQRLFTVAASWTVLAFDDEAAAVFNDLSRKRLKIGTMDLRIASIARARDSTLLSRNIRDFERVPGLDVQNWLDSL